MKGPIHVVDEVTRGVRPLKNEREAHSLFLYDSPNALSGVHVLYSLNLPLAVVNNIINFVGIWSRHVEETRENISGRADLEAEILRLTVPLHDVEEKAVKYGPPVELVLDCVSHDQGWATDSPELNQTYHGCHSWIEFDVQDPNGVTVVPRRDVCRNLRASRSFRHHMLIVRDPDVLEHVLPGCNIVVYMRAQYGGWANYVEFCRVALHRVVIVREEADRQELRRAIEPLHDDLNEGMARRLAVPEKQGWTAILAAFFALNLQSFCAIS